MNEDRIETANARMQAMLDRADVRYVALDLTPETVDAVDRVAEEVGAGFERTLALALVCGLLDRASAETAGIHELHQLSSTHAALRFQVFKLERGIFLEEVRARGTAGENETFEALSERLRRRIDAARG